MRRNSLALVVTVLAVAGFICTQCAPASRSNRAGSVNKKPANPAGPNAPGMNGNLGAAGTPPPGTSQKTVNKVCDTTSTASKPSQIDINQIKTNLSNKEEGSTAVQLKDLPDGTYSLNNIASSYATPADSPSYVTYQEDGITLNLNQNDAKTKATQNCMMNFVSQGPTAATQGPGGPVGQQQIQPSGQAFPIEAQFSLASGAVKPQFVIGFSNRILNNGSQPDTEIIDAKQPNGKQSGGGGLISQIRTSNWNLKGNNGYDMVQNGNGANTNELFLLLSSDKTKLTVFYQFYDNTSSSVRSYFMTYSISQGASNPPPP